MDEIYVRGFWRPCGPEMKRHVDEYRRQRHDQQYNRAGKDVDLAVTTPNSEALLNTKTGQHSPTTDREIPSAERRPPELVSEAGTRQNKLQAHALQAVLPPGPTQAANKSETSTEAQGIEHFE